MPTPEDRAEFRALLDRHGFDYIPQIFTSGNNVAEHVESFRAQVEEAGQDGNGSPAGGFDLIRRQA